MTTKGYLNQIRWLTIEINSRKRVLLQLREEAYGLTSGKGGPVVSSSGNSSKIEGAVMKLLETEEKIQKQIQKRERLRDEIEADIERLSDPQEKAVLNLRYVELLSWDEISEQIHYATRTAQRIHGRALNSLERIRSAK